MVRQELADDELMEIFVRLPLKSVHQIKCVSKRFHTLISDASFICSYIKHRANGPELDHVMVYSGPRKLAYYQASAQLSTIRLSNDFSTSFNTRNPQFDGLEPSHGLLLCDNSFKQKSDYVRKYSLCNMHTKQQLQLPPLPYYISWSEIVCIRFMCQSIDREVLNQIEFTVLLIVGHGPGSGYADAHVFFSKTGCWNRYKVNCSFVVSEYINGYEQKSDVIVYEGVFHWCETTSCIVAYDPHNTPYESKVISLPPELASSYTQVDLVEGKIRVVGTYKDWSGFSVWELDDYGEVKCCNKYNVPMKMYVVDVAFLNPTNGEFAWLRNSKEDKLTMFNMNTCSYETAFTILRGRHLFHNFQLPLPQLPTSGQRRGRRRKTLRLNPKNKDIVAVSLSNLVPKSLLTSSWLSLVDKITSRIRGWGARKRSYARGSSCPGATGPR